MTLESFVTLLIVAWLGLAGVTLWAFLRVPRRRARLQRARQAETGIPRDRHSLFHNAAEAATPTGHGRKACWETPATDRPPAR